MNRLWDDSLLYVHALEDISVVCAPTNMKGKALQPVRRTGMERPRYQMLVFAPDSRRRKQNSADRNAYLQPP